MKADNDKHICDYLRFNKLSATLAERAVKIDKIIPKHEETGSPLSTLSKRKAKSQSPDVRSMQTELGCACRPCDLSRKKSVQCNHFDRNPLGIKVGIGCQNVFPAGMSWCALGCVIVKIELRIVYLTHWRGGMHIIIDIGDFRSKWMMMEA
jgi:hypothetical protein